MYNTEENFPTGVMGTIIVYDAHSIFPSTIERILNLRRSVRVREGTEKLTTTKFHRKLSLPRK